MTNELTPRSCVFDVEQLATLKRAALGYASHLRREAEDAHRAGRLDIEQRLRRQARDIDTAAHA